MPPYQSTREAGFPAFGCPNDLLNRYRNVSGFREAQTRLCSKQTAFDTQHLDRPPKRARLDSAPIKKTKTITPEPKARSRSHSGSASSAKAAPWGEATRVNLELTCALTATSLSPADNGQNPRSPLESTPVGADGVIPASSLPVLPFTATTKSRVINSSAQALRAGQVTQKPKHRHEPSPLRPLQQEPPTRLQQSGPSSIQQSAPPSSQRKTYSSFQSGPQPCIPRVSVPATLRQGGWQPSNSMIANIPRRTAGEVTPRPRPQLQEQPQGYTPAYFDRQALLGIAEAFERHLRSQPHEECRQAELFRVFILQEAICQCDWFYVVLHQLCCLRTIAPTSLPDNIKCIGDQPFLYLDDLLGSNMRLGYDFLHWSSHFPLPIMDFYSNDNLRDGYRETVMHVRSCLVALGQYWDKLRQDCYNQGASPLVQQMWFLLNLPSAILQHIIFKSIARLILGTAQDTENVLNVLGQLHMADRHWHEHGGRRSSSQVHLAINTMKTAFKLGCDFVRACRRGQVPPGNVFQLPPQFCSNINSFQDPSTPQPQPLRMPIVSELPGFAIYISPGKGVPGRSQPLLPNPSQAQGCSPALSSDVPEGILGFYRYMETFVMAPVRLTANKFCRDFEFEVTQQLFDRLPKLVCDPHTGHRQRKLDVSSMSLRLRCVKNMQTPLQGYTEWSSLDGIWPENTYFGLNEQCLETGGKPYGGSYLPVDNVRVGTNKIRAAINRERNDKSPYDYLLAIELVVTTSYEQIHGRLHHQSRTESITAIQNSLINTFVDDDEVAMLSSVLIIDILDPISRNICKTPVRGRKCKHRNCFDLDVFLGYVKREAPGAPSAVDVWRCPICRGDVRPTMMITDEFLVQVRQELIGKGVVDGTRKIIVKADGTWEPKEEIRTGDKSLIPEREERSKSSTGK